MTLANMRHNGVRSLSIRCELHEAVLNMDGYDEGVAVPSLGPRMVCTCCGIIGADMRPNWREPDRLAVAALMPGVALVASSQPTPDGISRLVQAIAWHRSPGLLHATARALEWAGRGWTSQFESTDPGVG